MNPVLSMFLLTPSSSAWRGRMLGAFRIVAGLMFVTFGTMKLFGYPASPMEGMPTVELMSQMGIGAMMEVVGGLAIAVGLFTRPVAFLLAGEMAVAYFQFHAPQGFYPTSNGGVAAVLYCFLFLYLAFAGAESWSVDSMIARRSARRS